MTKKQPKVLLRCAKAASSIVAKITIGVNATIKRVLDFGLHIYILNGAKGMKDGEVGMKAMRIKMTICFPMLDGETKDQAVDRLIERIDPEGTAIMSWNESEVEIHDHEE